jgi:hypothetical protein
LRQHQARIDAVIAEGNQLLNRLLSRPASQWRAYNLHILFGRVPLTEESYREKNELEPGAMTCLRLQELFGFHYVGRVRIDRILCQVKMDSGRAQGTAEMEIPLTPYRCKGDYLFPIRGSATVMGTPWNQVAGHRVATSQEFAIDVVDYRRGADGAFALSKPPASSSAHDYYLFGRRVLAIGAGTVVAVGKQWPDEWVENPLEYSEERIVELTMRLLEEGVAFDHAILGNYVIIDHHNGEFSLYAHMSQDALAVEVGDAVQQGQVIGRVGNTSNSEGPHLHFQLMDSADFQTANGLPVTFSNLPAGQAPVCDFGEANSLLYSDYLFVHTPE